MSLQVKSVLGLGKSGLFALRGLATQSAVQGAWGRACVQPASCVLRSMGTRRLRGPQTRALTAPLLPPGPLQVPPPPQLWPSR